MPVCRSARARSVSESMGSSALTGGASKTKKSLPKPCIFKNSMRIETAYHSIDALSFRSGGCAGGLRVLPYRKTKPRGIMRHVMVLNSKGGCGKSTLSTNIAVFFARDGHQVCLADFDPQRSSLDWLAIRPAELPAIKGVAAFEEGLRNVPRNTDILVIDAPARVHGTELNELVRRAETIIVPVLPSSIDIKACGHFMAELLEIGKVSRKQARLGLIANRVREYTLVYEELDQFLSKLKLPYLGCL